MPSSRTDDLKKSPGVNSPPGVSFHPPDLALAEEWQPESPEYQAFSLFAQLTRDKRKLAARQGSRREKYRSEMRPHGPEIR
jgi:hypothetical protein